MPDDTAAVQAYIDAGTTIPNGTYGISSRLFVRDGKTLRGGTAAGVILQSNNSIATSMIGLEGNCAIRNATILGTHIGSLVAANAAITGLTISGSILTGSAASTTYGIDLNGSTARIEDVIIDANTFSFMDYTIRLRDNIKRVRVTNNTITEWLHYGIQVRCGDAIGPDTILIEGNTLNTPSIGVGGARQMIVCYRDPETPLNCCNRNVRILGNTCTGGNVPYNSTDPNSRGTADQITLHGCVNFEVIGNLSENYGEIGISVTQWNRNGIVARNTCQNGDTHGMQISKASTRSTDILVTDNIIYNCAKREPGGEGSVADVMAGIYVQNGEGIRVRSNTITDDRATRLMKYGVLIGTSRDVLGGDNVMAWTDQNGWIPVQISSATDAWLWYNE